MPRSRLALASAAVACGCTALLLAGPALFDLYWMRVLTGVFMFATAAQALNIIAGYTGYPAFGNVVFFGIGAYWTAVLMTEYSASFPLALATSTLAALLLALVAGPPLLRLRGHYFAIGTLALNEAVRAIVENLGVTGGGKGLSLPIPPGSAEGIATLFYYLFLGAMGLALLVSWLVARSRFGAGLRAIRDQEEAAESLGVHTTRAKTAAWGISAMLTGLAGGIWAYWIGYIDPGGAFDMTIAVKLFVMALLGGMGTLLGPIIGAFFIELAATLVWSNFLNYHLLILGLIIVAVVLFLPGGLARFVRERLRLSFTPAAGPP
jgi:branched-chain amino acid transport system permease protein